MFKKIVVTGGSGRFGKILKNYKTKHKMFFPTKKELNILNFKSIQNYLKKKKPDILIHLAGLSRPMKIHEENISKSIDLNIIGTCNIVKTCKKSLLQQILILHPSHHYDSALDKPQRLTCLRLYNQPHSCSAPRNTRHYHTHLYQWQI